jgi:hypothetical protein
VKQTPPAVELRAVRSNRAHARTRHTFRRDESTFYIQGTGQPELEIAPTSDSTFKIVVVDAHVTFHREDDGSVGRLTLNQNGVHPATRVDDDPMTEEEMAAYVGRYFGEEVEAYWDVVARDGELVVTHRRMDDITLTPNPGKEDSFGGGFPFATLSFERGEDGAVTGFNAANGRTRDVWFGRVE